MAYQSEAFETGYEACMRGKPRSANPYKKRLWTPDQWNLGWDAAI